MARRYFEYIGGNSRKFYEIEVDGILVHRRWGRIGANGQSQTDTHGSAFRAREAADALIAEKRAKGYVERISAGTAPRTPPPINRPVVAKPDPKPVDVADVVALLAELEATAPINQENAVEAAAELYRELLGE